MTGLSSTTQYDFRLRSDANGIVQYASGNATTSGYTGSGGTLTTPDGVTVDVPSIYTGWANVHLHDADENWQPDDSSDNRVAVNMARADDPYHVMPDSLTCYGYVSDGVYDADWTGTGGNQYYTSVYGLANGQPYTAQVQITNSSDSSPFSSPVDFTSAGSALSPLDLSEGAAVDGYILITWSSASEYNNGTVSLFAVSSSGAVFNGTITAAADTEVA